VSQAVFGRDYAAAYDALYQDKDYTAECDLVERLFELYGDGPVRRVLDLGCGTGGHAIILAQRGFQVVGVDRAPDMLEHARARSSLARFEPGDIGTIDLGETFDAALMMFAVLGYQVTNSEAEAALRTARHHLRPGGFLFSDFWYGPAVLAQRPSDRVKLSETTTGRIIRVAGGEFETWRDVVVVRYQMWRIESDRVIAEVREQHVMRYFFVPELEMLLAEADFELVRVGAFPAFDDEPSERTWNVALVARAV
jgi:SAM-dependent methyltransferase